MGRFLAAINTILRPVGNDGSHDASQTMNVQIGIAYSKHVNTGRGSMQAS